MRTRITQSESADVVERAYRNYGAFNARLASRASEGSCYDGYLYTYYRRVRGAGWRVLDIGCGNGEKLATLEGEGGASFTGCDPLAEEREGRVSILKCGAMTFIANCPEKFDFVILNDVLEHLSASQTLSLLDKLVSICSQDARIYVQVPNCASPFGGFYMYGDVTHQSQLNENSLSQLAGLSPFEIDHFADERGPLRKYRGLRYLFARTTNTVARYTLAMLGFVFFRRRVHLMPNLIAVLRRAPS